MDVLLLCAFASAEMCLSSRCLAMGRRVTVLSRKLPEKTVTNFDEDSPCHERCSNPRPPECKFGALSLNQPTVYVPFDLYVIYRLVMKRNMIGYDRNMMWSKNK
jgi:hypothetical protein